MLLDKIKSRQAVIGIVGMGHVGLPLALRFAQERFRVIGFDIDPAKVEALRVDGVGVKSSGRLEHGGGVPDQPRASR